MKRIELAVLVAVVLFASLAMGQTNRWVSDGTEWILRPDDVTQSAVIVEHDDIPDLWGGEDSYPKAYRKMADDGAEWIALTYNGQDLSILGVSTYGKTLGTVIPTGTYHSRMTFWGCADDSILCVVLYDYTTQTTQTFYSRRDINHIERLVRIDMTEATITPGGVYELWVLVRNTRFSATGLIYYLSVDYSSSPQSYFFTWQAGWAQHSLPFRPTSTYDQLIDIFPYATNAMYWSQEQNTWVYLDETATLTGGIADTVRSHSIFIYHSSPGGRYVQGYPIYEQRFLDVKPGSGVSYYRHPGTVSCLIPFDCSSAEPDDECNSSILNAWSFVQGSGYSSITDIDPFGASPYGKGYQIEYCTYFNTIHLDLRCEFLLLSSVPSSTSESYEIPQKLFEYKRNYGYNEYTVYEEAVRETVNVAIDISETEPYFHEPMPYPPGFVPKASASISVMKTLSVSAYPNPFNSTVEISVTVPDGTDNISVTIYDINGKMIKELTGSAGNIFRWDGTDQKGRSCPAGSYLYRVLSGEETTTGSLLFVK